MTDRNQQLKVEIIEGVLKISIGVDLLVHAVTHGADFWPENELVVSDNDEFAAAIAQELENDCFQEDGTTVLHVAFDKAAELAVENGCEGIADAEESCDA